MTGVHHVTGITSDVQANVDFYAGLLGLRLVKQTINHSDPGVLHLFYGDAAANPGTLLTFFAWPDGAGGRRGHGQATEVGLLVPRASIGYWTSRLLEHGVPFQGPTTSGSETRLTFEDPDGLQLVLVGAGVGERPDVPGGAESGSAESGGAQSDVPAADRIRGIAHVTLWTEDPAGTGAMLEEVFGFVPVAKDGAVTTYSSGAPIGGTVHVRDVTGFWPAADGAGNLHHVALRSSDGAGLAGYRDQVLQRGLELSEPREHGYFTSIYFREPGGSLIEVATDGPGMTLDESPAELGSRLVLPPGLEPRRADIEVVMPPFALPGTPRRPDRSLGWVHRYVPGTSPLTLLVLHGSGGSETQLLPLARRAGAGANLLAPRGRSTAEEQLRYFARRPDGSFDVAELEHEADALAEFVVEAADWYSFDPAQVIILGYSNGAHVGAAALARNPATFEGAALLRTVAPVELPSGADLSGKRVLMLQGAGDKLLRDGADERLAAYLRAAGADLTLTTVEGGHLLGAADDEALAAWLTEGRA